MTMFRKVFSSHVSGDAGDEDKPTVSPAARKASEPDPELLAALRALNAPEDVDVGDAAARDKPVAPVAPPAPAVMSPDASKPARAQPDEPPATTENDGSSVAARAAAAHRQIMEQQASAEPARPVPTPQSEPDAAAEKPARRQAGRARTRLLGFNAAATATDPFAKDLDDAEVEGNQQSHPTGWIVVIAGPGQGEHFPVYSGVAMIGRGDDQAIRLDFGDMAISRKNHAAIAYDAEDNKFYLGHGGKSNIIRLNDRPVLSTEELSNGDTIRIGETVLRFAALCGPDFQWSDAEHV